MAKSKSIRKIKKNTRRSKGGGIWPFSSNEPQQQPQQIPSSNLFMDTRLSTEPNQDSNYEDAGIIHATEAVGINIARTIITNVANVFGSKGVDLSRYDVCRTAVLTKILNNVPNGYKVCNIKMDIENGAQNANIHVHAYGSLMKPKMMRPMSPLPPIMSPPPIKTDDIKMSFEEEKSKPQVAPAPMSANPNRMNQMN
jgi:hypothetical protein